MAILHPAYRTAQVFTEPWFYTPAQIAEGKLIVIGPYGDHNPGAVLSDIVARSVGAKPLFFAKRLVDVLSGTPRFSIPETSGELELRGDVDTLYVYNAEGSTSTADAKLHGALTARKNSGHLGGHPGHGDFGCRIANAANAATAVTITAPWNITVTAIRLWSKAVATSAAGTYLLTVTGNGNNLLSAASYSLEGLVSVTLTAMTLTATAANLNIDAGKTIVLTATSNNVDLSSGDLVASVEYTLRT